MDAQPEDIVKIFYSYASEDQNSLDELKKQLVPFENNKLIEGWDRTKISFGSSIQEEVEKHRAAADLILLLVSPDFVNSEAQRDEVAWAMQRREAGEAHVIPIILRSINWKLEPFGMFQPLPKNQESIYPLEDKDRAFSNLADEIGEIVKELKPSLPEMRLLSLLKEMDWPTNILSREYQASIPEFGPSPNFKAPNLLKHMVEILVNLLSESEQQLPPLLDFVQRLAFYAQTEGNQLVSESLLAWVRAQAKKRGLKEQAIQNLYHTTTLPSVPLVETSPYLLIMLQPSGDESLYCVQAWLLDSNYQPLDITFEVDDTPVPLPRVRELINDIFQQIWDRESFLDLANDIIVEFSLPRQLFNNDVDQWVIHNGLRESELGFQYKVVVRSFERAVKFNSIKPPWRAKWRTFQKFQKNWSDLNDAAPTDDPIWICSVEECSVPMLRMRLRGSPIVCFVFPPVPLQGEHLFMALLETGVPIALWSRIRLERETTFTELLSYDKLPDLPKEILKERQRAEIDQAHSGRHLSLMWDDPFRLPPSTTARPLISPARKG